MNRSQAQQVIDLGQPMYSDMRWPGNGYPNVNGSGMPSLTPWARFSRQGNIGKKSVLIYDAETFAKQPAGVDMISLTGDDCDATPMILTLAPPMIIPLAFEDIATFGNSQNLTGEQGNFTILDRGNFPGTASPAEWPPLQAIIEWGTGGTSARASVDYVNGLTVNISASYVRVHASIADTTRGDVNGTSAAYVLAAFVSPGFTKPGVAQKTVYVGGVTAAGESDVFAIPRFAKDAYLYGADDSAIPNVTVGTIRFWQDAGTTKCVGNAFVSGNQPSGFRIPNGAQYFTVSSGMSATTLFGVIFDLAI